MKVAVIGAGSWGTALAAAAHDAGHVVRVWAYEPDVAADLREGRNSRFLPDTKLPAFDATNDLAEAVRDAALVISVMPSHVVGQIWSQLGAQVRPEALIVSATKGIDDSGKRMSELIAEHVPIAERIVVLSGPSFAKEVATAQPTAVVVAGHNASHARTVQQALATKYLRLYSSDDPVGVEIGGAAKNVIAIAVGIAEGLGFGLNVRAALITRGCAEVTRLAVRLGANPLTLAGLAGIGDLVLTCTGGLSRNRSLGLKLGAGSSLSELLADSAMVVEGVENARSISRLAQQFDVDMPITQLVHQVLHEGLEPKDCATLLMERELKTELEGIED